MDELLVRRINGVQHRLVKAAGEPTRHPFRQRASDTGSIPTSRFTSSEKAKEAKARDADLKIHIALDRVSFMSGTSQAPAESAHVLNVRRPRKGESKEVVDEAVKAIEAHLNTYNFHLNPNPEFKFTLDGLHNRILLTTDEHRMWDYYAGFALVPSLGSLGAISGALEVTNAFWNAKCHSLTPAEPTPRRTFDEETLSIFKSVTWTVLLLLPRDFLPLGELRGFAKVRDPFDGKGTFGVVHTHSTDPSYPYLLDEMNEDVLAHTVITCRDENDTVSLFAMISNAYAKLEPASRRKGVHPVVAGYFDSIHKVMENVFYQPQRPAPVPALAPPDIAMDLAANIDSATPAAASSFLSLGDGVEYSATHAPAPPGGVSEWLDGVSPDFMPELLSPEPPEQSVTADGLTKTELNMLLTRSVDAGATSQERVQAMMLLMFGAGGADDDADSVSDHEPDDITSVYDDDDDNINDTASDRSL
ncbi:hypothetical protein EXIGLDRAFT_718230 [Exidia glandulosa HHB12029]|uniref:Uncharacterized protein n=1 Tax=Exidia glandulosa HHB12029 TaxID=1314781 RepID=A0A165HWJ4_EXIGL|nr:hypothetical protein EXIGLDRAFT_718230 [Exidia glandulosa HHB12029]